MVSIKDLKKAEVLKALWDHSHCDSMSFLENISKGSDFTLEMAEKAVQDSTSLYFDIVHGRTIKCDISGDEINERVYDDYCGNGTALAAINSVRKELAMKNNYYEGPFISIKLRGYRNNDQIAQKFHESLVGKSDYIESNVILNKDPDYTTGNEQTGLYLCVNDMDDYRGIVDTITNVLKSIHENND